MASSGFVTTMMMAVGRSGHRLLGRGFDDLVIGQQKIVAAHAGLAGEPGGDDDDIGIRRRAVIVRAVMETRSLRPARPA